MRGRVLPTVFVTALALVATLLLARGAVAGERYVWRVVHPDYGDIGTYADTIDEAGGERRILTEIRIAVRILGIVMHRDEAERRQVWRDGRLVAFDSVTVTNGRRIEVHGYAVGDAFELETPRGPVTVEGSVGVADPWTAAMTRPRSLIFPRAGRVVPVRRVDEAPDRVTLPGGGAIAARHVTVESDRLQEVWLSAAGVPVRFRSVEEGKPIDFVLVQPGG